MGVRQSIRKYSWTPACDSQLENTSGHPCDSHFPKGISAFSQSFPLKHLNKTNVYERIPHYASCQQCKPCQQCQQCQQFQHFQQCQQCQKCQHCQQHQQC